MVAQGQGNQGQSGQNGSGSQNNGRPSGQSSLNRRQGATTITSSQQQPTTTSNPFPQTITASPTSTSTTLTSSSTNLTKVIIGAVIGGVGALLLISLLISLLAIWLLQRRKKRVLALENNTTQPVTYAGLNSAFSDVPFRNTQTQQALLPNFAQRGSAHSSNSDVGLCSGAAGSTPMLSAAETDLFLPSYAESQAAASIYQYSPTVSPMSSRAPNSLHISITPQTIDTQSMRTPVLGRDTIGFPVEGHDFEMMRLEQAIPNSRVLIVAPLPRHHLVQQDSLERASREGMVPSLSPALSLVSNGSTIIPNQHLPPNPSSNPAYHSNINPASRASSVMSEATNFESPVLGDPNRWRFQNLPASNHLNMSSALGLTRNESQRTVSTVSSMGISVISDGGLDRLGVGAGAGAGAVPMPMPARYH